MFKTSRWQAWRDELRAFVADQEAAMHLHTGLPEAVEEVIGELKGQIHVLQKDLSEARSESRKHQEENRQHREENRKLMEEVSPKPQNPLTDNKKIICIIEKNESVKI